MPTRRQSGDPELPFRRGIIVFGMLIVGASFVLFAISGQASSILVGAGVALVATGLSPQLAQLVTPTREYEPPPVELPPAAPDETPRREHEWGWEDNPRDRRDTRDRPDRPRR
jgi:hypothetical protein